MLQLILALSITKLPEKIEDPRALAEKYLAALADGHDQSGKDHLFGGLTLDAVTANALQPEIVSQGAKRSENGKLEDIVKMVAALDAQGTLTSSLAEAKAQMDKTKTGRREMMKRAPVFSDVIRADRPLYWHPRNPMRETLAEGKGTYRIDYVPFTVRSLDSSGKAKTWPLRIIRIKTDTLDTGWKVLAASEWDPE